MTFGLTIFTLTLGIASIAKEAVNENVEELDKNNVLHIYPRIHGTYIPQNMIDEIKNLDNVVSVISQYNIYGLLEESKNNPIYNVTINGFDFNEGILEENIDYRGMNVSGIVLPNLTVSLNGEKVMEDYVGRTVFFTYEYREGEKILSETIECKVLGTYSAYGAMEENPLCLPMAVPPFLF